MKRIVMALALVAGVVLPSAVRAQVGIAARGGSLGVGGEANIDLGKRLSIRGGIGSIPVEPSATIGDVDYTLKPPSTLQNVGVDLYPLGGNFRISGGFLFKHDVALEGTSNTSYNIGGRDYSGAEAGIIRGDFTYSSTAPYATIGFAGHGKGLGLSFDIGAAKLGEPTVGLTSSGGSMSSDPTFRANLDRERVKVQDKANKYAKILPIVSLALRFGF